MVRRARSSCAPNSIHNIGNYVSRNQNLYSPSLLIPAEPLSEAVVLVRKLSQLIPLS